MARLLQKRSLFETATALNTKGTVSDDDCGKADAMSFYVVFAPATSAGQVTIEGSHDANYAGLWAAIAVVDFVQANRVHNVAITGNHIAIRARITDAIIGGSASVYVSVVG